MRKLKQIYFQIWLYNSLNLNDIKVRFSFSAMNLSATSLLVMCCAAVLLTATTSSGQQFRPSLAQRLKIARESMFKGLNRKQLEGSDSVSSSSSSEPGSVAPLVSTSAVPPVEDQSGASDVVRQLTESYEPEQDDEVSYIYSIFL